MKFLVQGLNPDSHNIGLLVRTVKDFSFINRKGTDGESCVRILFSGHHVLYLKQ